MTENMMKNVIKPNNNNNWGRTHIAQNTLEIIKAGHYKNQRGAEVSLQAAIQNCADNTTLFTPDMLQTLPLEKPVYNKCSIEMINETTLEGAKRLSDSKEYRQIGILNFASAKHPGGGFLRGAHAQEESLARSSALYPSLLRCPAYYNYHKHNKSLLYSDHIIYSPACAVFKDDDGMLLEMPYFVDVITSPAPNRGAISRNEEHALDSIESVFKQRIGYTLKLAVSQGCDALVLGAWGCGVFGNYPEQVAALFAAALTGEGEFAESFHHISFSIPENPKEATNTSAFQTYFNH